MLSLTGLQGHVALITDAGAYIGRAVALSLARAGASVVIHAGQGESDAETVAEEARRLGVKATTVAGDITELEAARAVVGQAQARLGPIDILVNCVGIRPHSFVANTTVDEWQRVLNTNCLSFFYLAQRLLPTMTERGFGRLIAVGVALDDRAIVQHATVAAARAALRELVKVVAEESGGSGITASVVSVAITEATRADLLKPEQLQELLSIPRPGRLDEIAFACSYLASEQGAYITGQTLHVDGGYTI
jgi:3-oxoacyl-[acyl-carrier protein] reductase